MAKKIYDLFCVFSFLITCIIVIVFPITISSSVRESLVLCAKSIIPSLFPFMVLTQILSLSNIGYNCATALSYIISPLFGIKKDLCGCVLLGFLGGFPNGVHSVGISYNRGLCSKIHAEHAVAVCNNPSFAFVLTIAGIAVLGNIKYGLILYASLLLSCIETSYVLKFMYKNELKANTVYKASNSFNDSKSHFSEIICFSISESTKNILNVCSYIIIFYTISSIFKNVFIKGIIEISSGIFLCCYIEFPVNLIICSGLLGFSGISVIFQVTDACLKYGLSPKMFIISRFLNILFMPINTALILLTLPKEAIPVFNQYSNTYISAKPTATLYVFIFTGVISALSVVYKWLKNSNLYKK